MKIRQFLGNHLAFQGTLSFLSAQHNDPLHRWTFHWVKVSTCEVYLFRISLGFLAECNFFGNEIASFCGNFMNNFGLSIGF